MAARSPFDALSLPELAGLAWRHAWLSEARAGQLLPEGDWDTAIWLAGRGHGKTRILVEAAGWEAWRIPNIRVHALAPTAGDIRKTVFEGESGFLEKLPKEIIAEYNRSTHELTLVNGSRITGYSVVEEADRLRGPQCHFLIFDEAAASDRPAGNLEAAYNVASLGCRLPYPDGSPSRKLIATTPRPIPFLRNLIKRPGARVIRGTTYENLKNLSASFLREILQHEGTAYGKQEIQGELLEMNEGAIFPRPWFRLWPNGKKFPEFAFVMMSLDTAFDEENFDSKKQESDYSACGVYGIFNVNAAFTPEERKRLGVKQKYAALVCDFWMERLGFPELAEKTRKQYRTKYGAGGPGGTSARRPELVLIEVKGSGISLRQTLIKYGVPTWPYNPGRQSKTMRAHAAAPLVKQGMLFVPESARPDRKGMVRDWIEPMLLQVCAYSGPGSVEHDDALDQMTQAMLYLSNRGFFQAEPEERAMPDQDEAEEKKQRDAVARQERNESGRNPYAE